MDERLEDIKEQLLINAKLKIEDVNYLLREAKKVPELEVLLHGSRLMTDKALEDIEKLREENQKLKTQLDNNAWMAEQIGKKIKKYEDEEIPKLQQQNNRYKEALAFYAYIPNYEISYSFNPSPVETDGGKKARQALRGEST